MSYKIRVKNPVFKYDVNRATNKIFHNQNLLALKRNTIK